MKRKLQELSKDLTKVGDLIKECLIKVEGNPHLENKLKLYNDIVEIEKNVCVSDIPSEKKLHMLDMMKELLNSLIDDVDHSQWNITQQQQ
jgi:uncharacterized FlaG/YvyC family protein